MEIVKPYAKLMPIVWGVDGYSSSPDYEKFDLSDGIRLLKRIEWCARISHRSEDKVTTESYDRFLRFVILEKGDWSVAEHCSVSVDMLVDRGITHEIVRHRLFSYTQESTRFVNYEKKMPPKFIEPEELYGGNGGSGNALGYWNNAINYCELAYTQLIKDGVSPQIARSVLPNALSSRIIITGNLRNWRHFFLMRTSKEAHPQMREVTIPLLTEFKSKIPILYEDIEPMAKQSENMKKMR